MSLATQSSSLSTPSPNIEVSCSRYFLSWLAQHKISLALTTYQSCRLLLVGVNPEGQFSGFERLFDRAMGLYATTERLYLSSKYQLWQLDNVLAPEQLYKGYDKLYVPRIGYTTGDLDIHDIAVDSRGRVIFVSTLLNCLATVSQHNSCTPLWHPPFISQVVNEDRCHLNGLAMVEGQPRYVTAVSQSDVVDGWRDKRRDGGCVIDVLSNEVLLTGLSMPHSPQYYQGKLWLLNSGTGEFGYVDLEAGKFEPVTFCPGYLRGLAFWEDFAIVGLSKPRAGDKTFSGLALDEQLVAKDTEPRCGLMVIDLNSGAIVHWLRLEGVITELYGVQVLPGVQRPMALGFQTDEICRLLTLDPMSPLE
ncbi:MAG: TIGR03032 family protein [Symploca sp. SIO2G7]|nr:TIGR03032 family protein [Symploca sp. SIO2G7]